MTILTATNARKDLFDLIKGTNERHEIFHIRHRSGDAVLMSETEYQGLLETLALQSSPGFRKAFKNACKEADEGNLVSFDEVFGEAQ